MYGFGSSARAVYREITIKTTKWIGVRKRKQSTINAEPSDEFCNSSLMVSIDENATEDNVSPTEPPALEEPRRKRSSLTFDGSERERPSELPRSLEWPPDL